LHFVANDIISRSPMRALPVGWRPEEVAELVEQMRAIWQRRADYHTAMRRKYERAAMYPWLAVESDPPEPEL
jgi:hypothetical protein